MWRRPSWTARENSAGANPGSRAFFRAAARRRDPRGRARGARCGEGQARPQVPPPVLDGVRRDEAAAIVAGALQRGADWLLPKEVQGLLSCYGLPLVRQRIVPRPEDTGAAA